MGKKVVIEIFDHNDLGKIRIKRGKWRHAFIRDEEGDVILAQVFNTSKGRSWCPASVDCADRSEYNRTKRSDPTYYGTKTWEAFVVWVLKGCFKVKTTRKKT